jgi:Trypsin-like peptidase domain
VDIERWKRATVHIEGASDSAEVDARRDEIWQAARHISDPNDWHDAVADVPVGRDVRSRGTAVFVRRGGRRYLVTARHVLRPLEAAPDSNDVHDAIFRVPSLDEAVAAATPDQLQPAHLGVMAAGPTWMRTYSYDHQHDLAVIALDSPHHSHARVADELDVLGYHPLDDHELGIEPEREGDEVMAIGFPGNVANLETVDRFEPLQIWTSAKISVPIVRFGRIAMLHRGVDYFVTNIDVYPGNSGGPIIANGQLVGIILAQAGADTDTTSVRAPMVYCVAARHVRDLVDTQRARDDSIPA